MRPEILEQVREMIRRRKLGGRSATGADLPWSCDETPRDLFYTGLEQFNRGQYFEQHESLEEIWILETRPIRYLYQGILRIGVGFYKLRLGNYRGTVNHINGGISYLQPFGDECLGVDIARLIREAAQVRDRVIELGPDRLDEFDLSTLPKVSYVRK
jgi:predicted metal-dependent hydrolase